MLLLINHEHSNLTPINNIHNTIEIPEAMTTITSTSTSTSTSTQLRLFPRIDCGPVPDCPVCDTGYFCVQTIPTSSTCPEVVCKAITNTSNPKATIGGITGGVVGLVLVFVVLGMLFYKFYFKKKIQFNRVQHQSKEFYFNDDVEMQFHHNLPADHSSHGINDLEKPSTRTSIATTIFTRASNIIPIAYIPGVTTASTSNKTKNGRAFSIYSENTIDSDISGDRFSKASIIGNPMLTTTAIRAKPRLVNISESSTASSQSARITPSTAINVSQFGGVRTVKLGPAKKADLDQFKLQNDMIEEEEEEEAELEDDYDPFIIDDDDDARSELSRTMTTHSRVSTLNGSVILDVEMDEGQQVSSPFDDSFGIK